MTYFLRVPIEMKPLLIGILGFDGVTALDLAGPLDALAAARVGSSDGTLQRGYKAMLIGLTSKTFVAESGIALKPKRRSKTLRPLDTVVIPGGNGIRNAQVVAKIADWLKGPNKPRRIVAYRRVFTRWRPAVCLMAGK